MFMFMSSINATHKRRCLLYNYLVKKWRSRAGLSAFPKGNFQRADDDRRLRPRSKVNWVCSSRKRNYDFFRRGFEMRSDFWTTSIDHMKSPDVLRNKWLDLWLLDACLLSEYFMTNYQQQLRFFIHRTAIIFHQAQKMSFIWMIRGQPRVSICDQ